MKKILFKSGSTMLGGLEKVQIEYINYFIKSKEYDIKVVIENDNGPFNILEEEIEGEVLYLKDYEYIKRIKSARDSRKKSFLKKLKYNMMISKERAYSRDKFLEVYYDYNPDIVIDFDSSLNKFIEKLEASRNIVWVHSSVKDWKKTKRKISNYCSNLRKYEKVICICKEMEDELHSLDSSLLGKTQYIYNPMNFNKIIDKSKIEFLDSEKELAEKKYLLTVARLDCIPKDFETLFEGYKIAVEKGYKGNLYIIGDGPDKEKVETMINDSYCNCSIKLLGKKSNPYNWMKNADIFILSSKYEGFPTVLLEALTSGVGVISSRCKTGPKEILDDGRVGELFDVGDTDSLAEMIVKKEIPEEKKIKEHLKKFGRKEIFSKLDNLLEEL